MNSVTITFSSPCLGFPLSASDGQVVTATVPTGCVLRTSLDCVSWQDVTAPITHAGVTASYRIDCVSCESPVTAILTVSG